MLKAVVFDLDETLICSKDAILAFFRDLYKHLDLPFPEKEKAIFYTASERGILERLFPDLETRKRAVDYARRASFSGYTETLELKPHAEEILERLHGRYKLALATNRGDTTPGVLKRFDIARFFDIVVHARTLAFPKPHPMVMETILEELMVEPGEAVFVGDSEIDVQTARNGNMRCIIVGGMAGGDFRIDDLSGLPDVLALLDQD